MTIAAGRIDIELSANVAVARDDRHVQLMQGLGVHACRVPCLRQRAPEQIHAGTLEHFLVGPIDGEVAAVRILYEHRIGSGLQQGLLKAELLRKFALRQLPGAHDPAKPGMGIPDDEHDGDGQGQPAKHPRPGHAVAILRHQPPATNELALRHGDTCEHAVDHGHQAIEMPGNPEGEVLIRTGRPYDAQGRGVAVTNQRVHRRQGADIGVRSQGGDQRQPLLVAAHGDQPAARQQHP